MDHSANVTPLSAPDSSQTNRAVSPHESTTAQAQDTTEPRSTVVISNSVIMGGNFYFTIVQGNPAHHAGGGVEQSANELLNPFVQGILVQIHPSSSATHSGSEQGANGLANPVVQRDIVHNQPSTSGTHVSGGFEQAANEPAHPAVQGDLVDNHPSNSETHVSGGFEQAADEPAHPAVQGDLNHPSNSETHASGRVEQVANGFANSVVLGGNFANINPSSSATHATGGFEQAANAFANPVVQGNFANFNILNVREDSVYNHHSSSMAFSGFERAVNELAKDLVLERVKSMPDLYASISWTRLPPGFSMKFSDPVVVGYCGSPVLAATAGMITSDHQPHYVHLSLPNENEASFRVLASDIFKKDTVQLTLRGDFSLADHRYKLDAKMILEGFDSLQGAIDLEDVEILRRAQDGLSAIVKATIKNRTRIAIDPITLKSADIWYKSTKIGYLEDQTFKLLPGPNIKTFFCIFTPPLTTDGDNDFRGFISKFLTTDEVIDITLDIKRIQIKFDDRQVEFDGIEVNTSITGIRKPLITRVDVYLGLNALRPEIAFRFRLENPIHAPIEFIDCVVEATFNGHLISHFVHSFEHLAVSESLGEQYSEVITVKLNNGLLRTIWLVRGRTKFELEINIRKCKISIDGLAIHNLEFKLHGVGTRIHFGNPAAV